MLSWPMVDSPPSPARARARDKLAARRRARALLALGAALARRGVLAKISMGIAALTVLGVTAASFVVARSGESAPLEQMPVVAASALGWGAGVLLAFASAAHALTRDRADGIDALLRARGGSAGAYLWARVGGLGVLLAAVIAGGTLIAGLVAVLLASRVGLAGRALQGTVAALGYALAFAATVAPLAMAVVGARSRVGGYAWLLVVLVLPEVVARWTGVMVPTSFRELTSIPSALGAVRSALMPPGMDAGLLLRALGILAAVAALALVAVRRAAVRLDREGVPAP